MDPVEAARLVSLAVTDITKGGEDFAAAAEQLKRAAQLDPDNEAAPLFGAMAEWLDYSKDISAPGGSLHDLYTRGGLSNPSEGGSFWDFDLEPEDHGQGGVKDSTPPTSELRTWITGHHLPELQALIEALRGAPADFVYEIDGTVGGPFFEKFDPLERRRYLLDAGEIQLLLAASLANAGLQELLLAHDWDDVLPDDFDPEDHPDLDIVGEIQSYHPNVLQLVDTGALQRARDHWKDAWTAYLAASSTIRNETAAEQENGLLTLGRDMFDSPAERQEYLDEEAQYRLWGQDLVDHLDLDADFLVTTSPDGMPLAPDEQVRVNLGRFFQGQDLNALYLKTIVDPITGDTMFGVGDWGAFESNMMTLGGVLGSFGGRAPSAGDLAAMGYGIRVESPSMAPKTVDGSFADWTGPGDATQIAGSPSVGSLVPCLDGDDSGCPENVPDIGGLYVAVTGGTLYVRLDRDLTALPGGSVDYYAITVNHPNGAATVTWSIWGGLTTWSSDIAYTPISAFTPGQGLEMGFPTGVGGSGDWAEIEMYVSAPAHVEPFEWERENMFVKVR